MNGLVVIRNGCSTCERLTLDQAVERILNARKWGMKWDVRRKTTGQGYRILTEDEAKTVIGAVAARIG